MEGKKSVSDPGIALNRRRTPCSSCRRRKSKCDNRQPQCSTCVAHNSQCHYDKPPSLAYVRSLEARIEKLMQERSVTNPSESWAEISHDQSSHQRHANEVRSFVSPFESHSVEDGSQPSSPSYQGPGANHETKEECDRWVSEISVDSHGGVCYHNPTSAIHEAPSNNGREDSYSSTPPGIMGPVSEGSTTHANHIKQSLVSNAAVQRRFEAMALENLSAVQNEISSETASSFLKFHWCWIHPMFMFVYRPAFTRDMALSSPTQPETPYFSDTLLKVLLAHSSRFRVRNHQYRDSASALMDTLTKQAQFSLAMRLTEPSSIPTIQALLQQSAREIAFGNSSQAWLYSGMAFRIAIDLGIHLPSDKLGGYVKSLTIEDIEIRKRLFWSCYNWDKAISLYLGRMPAFNPPVESHVPIFMDDFTENDPWEPYYGSTAQDDGLAVTAYPQSKGHMISCFTGLCRISTILNTMMLEIYGSSLESRSDVGHSSSSSHDAHTNNQNAKTSAFIRISSGIQKWWTDLPDVIRLDIKNLPAFSPPLHIVSLNLLYHTTRILLHRPFIIGATKFESPAVQRSYQICIAAAAAIHDLLELLTNTFGYGYTTYLNCYSTYIAATIAVLHFQLQEEGSVLPVSDIPGEKLGLKFFLGVLQQSATGMPALVRSVEIVKRHMQAILDRRARRYLDSLFPVNAAGYASIETGHTEPSATSIQTPNQYGPFRAEAAGSSTGPSFIQGQMENDYQTYSGFNLEGLPAFPGQHFNVGADFTLDQGISDPEMRAALLGLDSHLTLHHENSDWAYGGFYMGDEMH